MKLSKIRKEIINEAVTWMGTPWQHQACVKNVAVDCAMFVAGVARNIGLVTEKEMKLIPNYPKDWHFHKDFPMLPFIMEQLGCKEKDKERMRAGDILVFKIGRVPSHLGILLEDNILIHAYSGCKSEVAMHGLSEEWLERMIQVYNFPGVK